MLKGIFKLVFGIAGAVVTVALIFVVTLVIGHTVTGSWNIREWKSDDNVSEVCVTECPPEG